MQGGVCAHWLNMIDCREFFDRVRTVGGMAIRRPRLNALIQ
jgi:hypothetical protein